ncbi:MAG: glycosyltransferase family 2 protein [Proteobacteria bacterium]|nr:glycosyltransferase family 2 protein [Pseudomonadota bacterium]
MYKNRRVILIAPAYNEEDRIGGVVSAVPRDVVDEVLVVDDGSTDTTAQVAAEAGARVLSLGAVLGVGAAIRAGYNLARAENFDIAVVIAGNGKDDPREVSRLLEPICNEDADFVMGSRFLDRKDMGDMPLYRKFATRLHPALVTALTLRRVTESTNGFRALKVSVLSDPRIRLDQPWLDHYQLEVYLLMKLLKLGYKTREVPTSKRYPAKGKAYTKMRPGLDWAGMLAPVFLVGLGIRK